MINIFKKTPEILRQGDILLIERDINLKNLKKCKSGRLTLAYGEVTGHAHRLEDEGTFFSTQVMDDNELEQFANTGNARAPLYLVVDNTTNLKHEEHAPIEVKGNKVYEVRRQREYDFREGYRRVAD